jgi:hypothetical protein
MDNRCAYPTEARLSRVTLVHMSRWVWQPTMTIPRLPYYCPSPEVCVDCDTEHSQRRMFSALKRLDLKSTYFSSLPNYFLFSSHHPHSSSSQSHP